MHALLDHDAPISTCDARNRTALHEAACHGRRDVLIELVQRKPDCVDNRDIDGWSVMHDGTVVRLFCFRLKS